MRGGTMASLPSRGRRIPTGRAPRTLRYFLYAVLVAGTGVVVHLGASLALTTYAAGPSERAIPARRAPAGGGALVICGGGRLPETVRDRFLELAGGPEARIVVIPTGHSYADGPGASRSLEDWKGRGVA